MRVTSYGTMGTEVGATITRRKYTAGVKRAVIACHGGGAYAWSPINFPEAVPDEMARRGYPVSSHELGGQWTWGNTTAQTKVGDARSYMQGAPLSGKAGKVLLLCGSMGTLAGLNYLRANAGNVAALAGILPAIDLVDLHDNRGFSTSINTAYTNQAGYEAAIATHSPAANAAAYAGLGVPIKLWYSTDDTVIAPSTVTAFAAASGAEIVSMAATGGHVFPSSYAPDVADFLERYA